MSLQALLLSKDTESIQVISALLFKLHIAVEPCGEPFTAAKRLMDQKFDLVIVDCDDQQGSGWVLQSVRTAQANRNSMTIALVSSKPAHGSFKMGENFVINKPILPKQAESTLQIACSLLQNAAKESGSQPVHVTPPETLSFQPPASSPQQSTGFQAPHALSSLDELVEATSLRTASSHSRASLPSSTAPDDVLEVPETEIRTAAPFAVSASSGAAAAPARAPVPRVATPVASSVVDDVPQTRRVASPATHVSDAAGFRSGATVTLPRWVVAVATVALLFGAVGFAWWHVHMTSGQRRTQTDTAPQATAAVQTPMPGVQTTTEKIEPQVASVRSTSKKSAILQPSETVPHVEPPSAREQAPAPIEVPTNIDQRVAPSTPPAQVDASVEPPSLNTVATTSSSSVIGVAVSLPAAQPTLKPVNRLTVSQGITQGLLLQHVNPSYPAVARQAHVHGDVLLQALIGKDGSIQNLKVLRGHALLAPAAENAVRQWRYRPYLLNGLPVEIETQITVQFRE